MAERRSLSLVLPYRPTAGPAGTLLDLGDGTRVTFREALVTIESAVRDVSDSPTISAELQGVRVELPAGISGLLASLAADGVGQDIGNIGLAWREGRVMMTGSAGLSAVVPINARVGPLDIRVLHARLAAGTAGVSLELSFDLGADIVPGAISVAVERLGIMASVDTKAPGLPISLAPKGPSGAAIAVNLPVVEGGGALSIDEAAGQYAGVFKATLLGMGVTATGILNTKLPPDMRPGFSLLVSLAADFKPVGIELSFGFTLNAIGGLIGINRTCDLEALRAGVRNGAINSVMFPADPIRNAPRILGDLARIFPPQPGEFIIAPMLELGWGKPAGMIALQAGLIVRASTPMFAFVGVMKVEIPPGLPLIRLQVNFLGVIDPSQNLVSFDASLFESRMLIASVEGDIAVRFRYGDQPDFLVAAGGFFPGYEAPMDLSLGPMRRLAVSIGPAGGPLRMRMEAYFAVTSNSIQHGARLEVALGIEDGFEVSGAIGYDVIIMLSPFGFRARVAASFAVKLGSASICSISIEGELTGPEPLRLRGRGSFKILFVRINVPVDITIGSSPSPPEPLVDVFARLREALLKPGSTTVELPGGARRGSVAMRPLDAGTGVALQPDGMILVKQSVVPLDVPIQRFGAGRPQGGAHFTIVKAEAAGSDGSATALERLPDAPEEPFAPGMFFDLSDEEKLRRPTFESHPAGVRIGGGALPEIGAATAADFGPESFLFDEERNPYVMASVRALSDLRIAVLLTGGAAARAKPRKEVSASTLRIAPSDGFAVVGSDDLALRSAVFTTYTEARNQIARLAAAEPALAGRIRVASAFDLVDQEP